VKKRWVKRGVVGNDARPQHAKRGFSLVELVIIVAVLGILAAIVIPDFQEHSTQAKEAVAKDSVRILRSVIELYAAQHGGVPPGYEDNNLRNVPDGAHFESQTTKAGGYMRKMPKNPFNNLGTMLVIPNSGSLPTSATGKYGWVYKPAAMTIKLDWPGSDKDGILYYEY